MIVSKHQNLSKQLALASFAAKPFRHRLNFAEVAGRSGEEEITTLVSQDPSCAIFSNVLIPKATRSYRGNRHPTNTRHHEIDLVVCTHKECLILEIKNWSGSIALLGNSWAQQKPGGGFVEHENPLEKLERKRMRLIHYLIEDGVVFPERFEISPKLIMANWNCTLPPEIAADERVVQRWQLPALVQRISGASSSSAARRWLAKTFPGILPLPRFGDDPTLEFSNSLVGALGNLRTFDTLELEGGHQVFGRFKGFTTQVDWLKKIDRDSVASVRFSHPRNLFLSSARALFGQPPSLTIGITPRIGHQASVQWQQRDLPVSRDHKVVFQKHVAGKPTVTFPLNEVLRMELSKT